MPDEDNATAFAETLAKLETDAREKARQAEEGDLLYDADVQGMRLRRRKQSSMVRSGDTPLPDRVPFYRSLNGNLAMLPTAQLAYHLSKKHPDGTAVFVRENPHPPKEPTGPTCTVCMKMSGRSKQFGDEYDYITHMENKHPREYRIEQEKLKRSDAFTPANLASALMSMSAEERTAIRTLLGGDTNGSQEDTAGLAAAKCEACGWEGKPVENPAASLGIHQRLHCPSRRGANPE